MLDRNSHSNAIGNGAGDKRESGHLHGSRHATGSLGFDVETVETVCRNVKRWRSGDHIERWVISGQLVAERQFRKVVGHREIPLLLSSLASAVSKKPIAKGVAVA